MSAGSERSGMMQEKMEVSEMAEKNGLVELLVKNLEQQLKAAEISLEDLQKLQETAKEIKKRKERIEDLMAEVEELKEQIEELKAEVEPVASVLRDADNLRLALIGLGLLDEETLKIIIGPIYKKNTKRAGGGKRTVFKGQVFNSANQLVKTLAEQGLIEIPKSSYSAVRLLKSWARKNGYKVTETETELIIE